ncbi:ATP-binding protein [Rhodococcus opacus]|uniref:ATP-binding protein n=1 Tax=Rhodococcus opacus TaxID=37919 RepID=UPI00155AF68B|nr:AAA family ATPase [Rhodococcus opacus]
MLTVYLLGEQRVSNPEDARVGPISSRAIALLAYLVLHAGLAQSRTRLAGLFWPESSEQQARTNLRRELHNLRGLLGSDGALAADGPTLTWTDSSSCRVDVDTFRNERSAAVAALADSDPRAFLDHADRAIDTYRGELMPGTYEDWVLEHREVLRRQCVELCEATVRVLRESGDVETATACARRRIQLDPLEEVGYRTLMELQAASGDRAAAMTTYHRCAAVLETELGVTPSAATSRLFDNLLVEHPRVGAGAARRPERVRTAVPALIGRERERGELHRRWQQSLDGRQGLLLVSGDAGVGKTRLTTELAEIARADGAVVATTRCFGLPGRVALAPVAEWLRSPDFRSAIGSLNPLWRAEVERLVPSAEPGPRPSTSRAMVDAWQRHRFFEGTTRAVLSSGRPVLLVLDDLQWCDAETTAWLAFLLSLDTHMRVLVAATARTDEARSRHDVREALRALRSARLVTDVEVDPLTAEGTAELARSLGGRALDPSEEAVLYAATGGYPLYVVEAARMVPGMDATGRGGGADDLGEVLQRRLEQCSEPARDVAGLAGALGTDFDLDLLSEASDLDADSLVQAVDELWRRRIVRPAGTGYDFVHDLVREAAYRSVSPPRRWLLHRRLAQGLELLHAGRTDDVAAQLAEQYRRGGRPDRALHYLQRAAEVAASVFANAEALRHFRDCLDLLEAMPVGRNRDAHEVDVRQGMSAPLTTLYGYSSAELEQTLDRTVELGQRLRRPKVVLGALIGLFAAHFVQGHTAQAHGIGVRALELSAADPEFEGQAQFAVAGAALALGRPRDAIEHFDVALRSFSDDYSFILGTRLEVHAHAWESHAYWMIGDEQKAARSCADALALGRTCGHPYSLAVALGYASVLYQIRGHDAALLASLTELRELCERYHFAYYSQWSQILEGRLLGGEPGIAKIREGLAELRRQRAFARMPYWLSLLAEVQIDVGWRDAARATLDAARIAAEQHDDRWWLPQVLRLRADAGPFAGGAPARTVRERRIPTV